jgi:hypothetical protein
MDYLLRLLLIFLTGTVIVVGAIVALAIFSSWLVLIGVMVVHVIISTLVISAIYQYMRQQDF